MEAAPGIGQSLPMRPEEPAVEEYVLALFDVKCCTKCGRVKALESFVKQGSGYRNTCKRCKERIRIGLDPVDFSYAIVVFSAATGWRHCPQCDRRKTVDQFYSRRAGDKIRYAAWCRICTAEYKSDLWENDAGYRRRANAASSAWHSRNPECGRRARDNNPELYRGFWVAASARRRTNESNLPSEIYTISQLIERDGNVCVLCERLLNSTVQYPHPMSTTVEHLECLSWPNSPGNVMTNVALAHFTCNASRRNSPHPAATAKRAELLAAERELIT